ncbi:hypothetical protein FSP39_003739 [Pinctada imbricata]|uniref:Ubiquitinyl hydrolase 1 n=1 Tax=Pinctada imbricata TaxID=66713 RepID=A0AA89BYL4_PINIB|nr:hypothetical protein FSP39_003739 [Pinctada imbricata]
MSFILELDKIEHENDKRVRESRKNAVKEIQNYLRILDEKWQNILKPTKSNTPSQQASNEPVSDDDAIPSPQNNNTPVSVENALKVGPVDKPPKDSRSKQTSFKDTINYSKLKNISEVISKAREKSQKIGKIRGDCQVKEYRTLTEHFMSFILELDKIEHENDKRVRESRKNAVKEIQNYLRILDEKWQNILKPSKSNTPSQQASNEPVSDDDAIPSPQNNNTPVSVENALKVGPVDKPPKHTYQSQSDAEQGESLSQNKRNSTTTKRKKTHESETINSKKFTSSRSNDSRSECYTEVKKSHSSSFHSGIANCSSDDDERLCPLDSNSFENILHYKIPPRYFTSDLPSHSSFYLNSVDFSYLQSVKCGRLYKKGKWQHIFIKGMKESNKYCVFIFERHQISSAKCRAKKQNTPFFKASAHCKFHDCTVKADLKMWEEGKVDVYYTGEIKHNIHHEHARPIRGKQREDLKETLKYGPKPLKRFLDCMKEKTSEDIVSGNCDNVGKDPQIFRQISHESRKTGRKDYDSINSLRIAVEEEKASKIHFIQKISILPFYILYWSEEGLYLYHKLAPKDVLFWDATGSVVRKNENGKRMLYYELSVRHPVKGKMGLPVSAMLTEDNSLPSVQDWIARFRHAEKRQFGHGNVSQPKLIISDESWVFILAALKEFNSETLSMYLDRAWRIFNGDEDNDMQKTNVHLCASHFMNKVRRFCRDNYRRHASLGLYMISLLLNCKTISEAEEILHDIIITLHCKEINENNQIFINRLFSKINKFDTRNINSETELNREIRNDHDYTSRRPGFYSEEDFISFAVSSSFKQWGESMLEQQKKTLNNITGERNTYHSEIFLNQIITRYLPIFPLWGSFMLQCDDNNVVNSKFNFGNLPRTQSTIENRFRILKYISLAGKKNSRVDDFSHDLKEHTIEIQRMAAKTTLKSIGKIKRKRKSTKTVEEQWNKKTLPNENLAQNVGMFQQPPQKKMKMTDFAKCSPSPEPSISPRTSDVNSERIKEKSFSRKRGNLKRKLFFSKSKNTPSKESAEMDECNSPSKKSMPNKREFTSRSNEQHNLPEFEWNICPMPNLGSTCWFNATIQAVAASKFKISILDNLENRTLNVDKDATFDMKEAIVNILEFIENNKASHHPVPTEMIKHALSKISHLEGDQLTSDTNRQQDANEFYTTAFASLAHDIGEKIVIDQTLTCIDCGETNSIQETHIQSLSLDIPNYMNMKSSTQLLLKNYFEHALRERCSSCKGILYLRQKLTHLPNNLVLCLKRVDIDERTNRLFKNEKPVIPDEVVDLAPYANNLSHTKYRLRSIVCHHGRSYNSGHYTCFLLGQSKNVLKVDDSFSSNVTLKEAERPCYILFYDRIEPSLPVYHREILKGLFSTKAMKMAIDARLSKYNGLHEISDNDLQWCLAVNSRFDIAQTPSDFLSQLIDHILVHQSRLKDAKYFNTVVEEVTECTNCELKSVKTQINEYLIHTKSLTSTQLSQNFKDSTNTCNLCNGTSTTRRFISLLPFTMILCTSDAKALQSLNSVEKIDLEDKIQTALPLISQEYKMSSLLIEGEKSLTYVRKNQKFCYQDDDGNVSEFSSEKITNPSRLICFFDMKTKCAVVPPLTRQKTVHLPVMSLPCNSRLEFSDFRERHQKKYKISVNDIKQLSKPSEWLSSDQINCYMELVEMSSSALIHAVDACWFSQRILPRGNENKIDWSLFNLENKRISWLDCSKVIIPINIRNIHWILLLVDISSTTIYYCDSQGNFTEIVLFQLIRYLMYECLLNTGRKLDISTWKLNLYCEDPYFPRQTDGSSCGIYVCEMAKAIVFDKKIGVDAKAPDMRQQVARELMTGVLEY